MFCKEAARLGSGMVATVIIGIFWPICCAANNNGPSASLSIPVVIPGEASYDRAITSQPAPANPNLVRRLPPTVGKTTSRSRIALIAHDQPIDRAVGHGRSPLRQAQLVTQESIVPGPATSDSSNQAPADIDRPLYPIDLATALGLGGANSLQIQLARQRVIEASIKWRQKKVLMLPSLWFGVSYNRHDGRLQETGGNILEIDRQSLFVGGGGGLDGASVAGGSGGPSRLVVNLSLADAIFEPMVARQLLDAQSAAEGRDTNNTLLAIAIGYFDLAQARAELIYNREGLAAAEKLVQLTTDFFETGKGAQAEVFRAKADRAVWRRAVQDAERRWLGRSSELVRLLRLNPNFVLIPVEDQLAPVEMVEEIEPLEELIATGLALRPEVTRHEALVDARYRQMRQEGVRPLLPNIQVGASGGNFGGGPSSEFDDDGGRGDVDLLAVWELQNAGFGNLLARRQRRVQLNQAETQAEFVQDQITAEIVTATADVSSYRQQIEVATEGVTAAKASYQANFDRIRAGEGIPIELLQAIIARTRAQNAYAKAISDYNRSQYRLLTALGQPHYQLEQ